jgi:hypothetical protein
MLIWGGVSNRLLGMILLGAVVSCGAAAEPQQEKQLIANLAGQPSAIALDADYVYVGVTSQTPTIGRIHRIPKRGRAQSTITDGSFVMNELAVDDSLVYFDHSGGGPFAVGKGGGAVTLLGSNEYAGGIAVDGERVYWTTLQSADGFVMSATKDGSQHSVLGVDLGLPVPIVVDGANVYWANQTGEIWAAPKGGGASTKLGAKAKVAPHLGQDGTHVYFAFGEAAEQAMRVGRVPKQGGAVQEIAQLSGAVTGVTVSGGRVYVGIQGAIFSIAVDGTAQKQINDTDSANGGLAVDGDAIYFASFAGDVYRVAQ